MNTLKPCSYCGNKTFDYLPNMAVDAGFLTTMLGARVKQGGTGSWWEFTLVACKQCGNTLIFTTNAQDLSKRVPGSKAIEADSD
jgi:hypothetical protein